MLGLTGLGNEGMLKFEERLDCLEVVLVAGEWEGKETESCESECFDGKPCSWNAVHADRVGELGVSDARKV